MAGETLWTSQQEKDSEQELCQIQASTLKSQRRQGHRAAGQEGPRNRKMRSRERREPPGVQQKGPLWSALKNKTRAAAAIPLVQSYLAYLSPWVQPPVPPSKK